mgnify:CR=1 FL=1
MLNDNYIKNQQYKNGLIVFLSISSFEKLLNISELICEKGKCLVLYSIFGLLFFDPKLFNILIFFLPNLLL